MDPKQLLQALMNRDGDNPNSLAAKVRNKTKQPQIHRFLKGEAKEPRRSTLQPLADHYGIPIDAFYDPSIAAQIGANLQAGKSLNCQGESQLIEPQRKAAQIGVAQAVVAIGAALLQVDELTRAQTAPIFDVLTREPGRAAELGQRLEKTLKGGNGQSPITQEPRAA
ncbi:hypothetical protein O4H66_17205 [Comamonadaceae bacterium G21597-S1]|nr:hypothetical protein [Comamonadaceae bacterium G21597-S1]